MPILDGEKWACQSCIKGHRVSGCQHKERELFHINPKGRPVKQCEHCRNTRKSKSHHVKCDCGDKKDKSHPKSKTGDKASCCGCNTGSKCTCGTKKESLKIDTALSETANAKAKPRLTATQSESTLTVFANGHHKPCHRNNNSAHTSGMPYKIPRPHTLHGQSFSAHHSRDSISSMYGLPAQRSVDALHMPDTSLFGQPSDSVPLTPISSSVDDDFAFNPVNYGFNTTIGMPQNETTHSSPIEPQSSDTLTVTQPWTWSTGMDASNGQFSMGNLSQSPPNDYMSNDNDWAIPSAGLNPSWEAIDLPLHPERLSNSLAQLPSHCGESRTSVPGLSTSSSQSEVGEAAFFADLDARVGQTMGTDGSWDDAHQFRKPRQMRGISNASTPPEMRQPPTSVPPRDGHIRSRASLDIDYMRRTSPPGTGELEYSYLMPNTAANCGPGTMSPEKMSVLETQFIAPSNLDNLDFPENGLPRSMTMPATIEEGQESAATWPAFIQPMQNSMASFENVNASEAPGFDWNTMFAQTS